MSGTTPVGGRRTEYVQQTREAILAAAEELFIRDGYRSTSVDAIAEVARFTKGAVYRHYRDKEALFIEVFNRVEVDAVAKLSSTTGEGPAVIQALTAIDAFLELATETRFRRIVLEEGPTALGWRQWRQLDHHHTTGLLEQLLTALMDEGAIVRRPVTPLARLCCALVGEAAINITEANDPAAAQRDALDTLNAMLLGLTTDQQETAP